MTSVLLNKTSYCFADEVIIEENKVTTSESSKGFIIQCEKSGDNVTTLGDVHKIEVESGIRQYSFPFKKLMFTVNGNQMNQKQIWLPNTNCLAEVFVEQTVDKILITAFSNGYVCIDNTFLIYFSEIKTKTPLQIKNKNNKTYFKALNVSKIFLNHREIALTVDGEYHYIHPLMPITENFYVIYNDGSSSNVEPISFNLPSVFINKSSLVPFRDFAKNFRCVVLDDAKIIYNKTDDVQILSLNVKRFNNKTLNINVICNFISQKALTLKEITIPTIHTRINNTVNFAPYNVKSVKGFDNLEIELKETYNLFECIMLDNSMVESLVIRDITQTTIEEKNYRFKAGTKHTFQTDDYYIYNNNIIATNKKGQSFSLVLTANSNELWTYNINKTTWTKIKLYEEVVLNTTYVVQVFSLNKPSFNLTNLGFYDSKETFNYYVNEKAYTKPKYFIQCPKDLVMETGKIIEEVKVDMISNVDKRKYACIIKFMMVNDSKFSFLVSDSDYFDSPLFKAAISFDTFTPYSTYGPFRITEEPLAAFHSIVTTGAKIFECYPIITFNERNVGTVITCEKTYKLETNLLTDNFELEVNDLSSFLRLNSCVGLTFENTKITAKKEVPVCFFVADQKIYLFRSSFFTGNSQGSFGSFSMKANASFMGTGSPVFTSFSLPDKSDGDAKRRRSIFQTVGDKLADTLNGLTGRNPASTPLPGDKKNLKYLEDNKPSAEPSALTTPLFQVIGTDQDTFPGPQKNTIISEPTLNTSDNVSKTLHNIGKPTSSSIPPVVARGPSLPNTSLISSRPPTFTSVSGNLTTTVKPVTKTTVPVQNTNGTITGFSNSKPSTAPKPAVVTTQNKPTTSTRINRIILPNTSSLLPPVKTTTTPAKLRNIPLPTLVAKSSLTFYE